MSKTIEQDKKVSKAKGFLGFKNRDPKNMHFLLKGQVWVLDQVAWRKEQKFYENRSREIKAAGIKL